MHPLLAWPLHYSLFLSSMDRSVDGSSMISCRSMGAPLLLLVVISICLVLPLFQAWILLSSWMLLSLDSSSGPPSTSDLLNKLT